MVESGLSKHIDINGNVIKNGKTDCIYILLLVVFVACRGS